MLEHVRAESGQYWLANLPEDPEDERAVLFFECLSVRIGDVDVRRLNQFVKGGKGDRNARASKALSPEKWKQVKQKTESHASSDLIPELMTMAESYGLAGMRRSALIEAVTAMELAIDRFLNSNQYQRLIKKRFGDRLTVESLAKVHAEIGKTGKLGVMFPLILTEAEMPKGVLEVCYRANSKRADLVHSSARDVKKDDLSNYLTAIRALIQGFDAIMKQNQTSSSG